MHPNQASPARALRGALFVAVATLCCLAPQVAHAACADAPGVVTLVGPANNATTYCSPTLQWSYAGDPGHTFEVVTFAGDVLASSLTTRSWTPSSPLPDGRVTWGVRVRNCVGEVGEVRDYRSFVVDGVPDRPVVGTPTGGAYTNTRPAFAWTGEAAHPGITYAVSVDGVPLAGATGLTVTTFRTDERHIMTHGSHTWSVQATGCNGSRAESTSGTFFVDAVPPEPFDLRKPDPDDEWFNRNIIQFEWDDPEDLDSGLASQVIRFSGGIAEFPVSNGVFRLPTRSHYALYHDFDASSERDMWTFSGTSTSPMRWVNRGGTDGWVLATWSASTNTYSNNANVAATLNSVFDVFPAGFGGSGTGTSAWLAYALCTQRNADWMMLEGRTVGGSWSLLQRGSGDGGGATRENTGDAWVAAHAGTQAEFRVRFTSDGSNVHEPCTEGYGGSWAGYFYVHHSVPYIADGRYTWHIAATDRVGNSRPSETRNFGIDRVSPSTAAVASPTISREARPVLEWQAAVDALSGIGTYRIYIDRSWVGSVPGDVTTFTPTTALTAGSHTWFVRAVDRAGNYLDGAPATLLIDLTPPTAPRPTAPAQDGILDYVTPNLCFTSSTDGTNGSGILDYAVYLDGAQLPLVAPGSGVLCVAALTLEGPHSWYVVARDRAGWTANSETRRFSVDLSPPLPFAKVSPPSGAALPHSYPELCWEPASDFGSGVARYELTLTPAAGGPPAVSTVAPTSGASVCTRVGPLAPGGWRWQVAAIDRAGYRVDADAGVEWTFDTSVDRTAPLCMIDSPAEGELTGGRAVRVSGRAVEVTAGSGVVRVEYCLDGGCATAWTPIVPGAASGDWQTSVLTLSDGAHVVRCRAVDREGNVQALPDQRSFTYDGIGPTAPQVTEPADGAWIANATPTLRWLPATDARSSVAGYWVRIGSRAIATLPAESRSYAVVPPLAEGRHAIELSAVDGFGNVGPEPYRLQLGVDVSAPSVPVLEAPVAGLCVSDPTPSFGWAALADGLSGVVSATLFVDGEQVHRTQTGEVRSHEIATPLADGPHEWHLVATDAAGNSASAAPVSFEVDTAVPVCTVLAVESDGGAGYLVSGTASDTGCGLASVTVDIVGPVSSSSRPEVGADGRWSVQMWPEGGAYEIRCAATDVAGNAGESIVATFRHDSCHAASACDEIGACDTVVVGNACDDGLVCTTDDACGADGSCAGEPLDCSATPGVGPCRVGTCSEEARGCVAVPLALGTTCGDTGCNADGDFVGTGVCDRLGNCGGALVVDCELWTCTTEGCASSCTSDLECAEGAWCDPDSSSCSAANRPPTADAGAEQFVSEFARVTLDGRASFDPDGDALLAFWSQVGGPDVTLESADTLVPEFDAPRVQEGELVFEFELTVSDGTAASEPARTTVTVANETGNGAPEAAISGPRTAAPGDPVTLDATGSSDPDGDALSFRWSSDPDLGLGGLSGDTVVVDVELPRAVEVAEVVFTLVVSDGLANSELAQHVVVLERGSDGPGSDPGVQGLDNEPTGGCACRVSGGGTDPRPAGALALLVLALLGAGRRRAARTWPTQVS